ncbi:MAG: TraR/DksA family transcriptional regulator [Anaerolineales bacterium]|nr:TraR/DksA family transcriptional regulator [Anaerolineales bacterium]
MTKKITKTQLAVLKQERDHTLAELENLRQELRLEMEIEDVDEVASELIERDKMYSLILTLERKLEDIDHAIKQAQEHGYGICERCGNAIDPERLEIFPETTFCINCKRESERLARASS